MDTCHCPEPAPNAIGGGEVCLNCRLPYREDLWRADKRRFEHWEPNREQQEIINRILEAGDHE